jgi:hypothetical protein
MKKILVSLAIVLLLSATVTVDTFAKPASCVARYRQCGGSCRDFYGGENPLTDGCYVGCAIGYLFC